VAGGTDRPTLSTLVVHMIQETARHAGHPDIIRESLDGATGERGVVGDLPAESDAAAWQQHYDKLENTARSAGGGAGELRGASGRYGRLSPTEPSYRRASARPAARVRPPPWQG
jgi:Protein of unknown function (DUF664)